jgi:hypothetical protein
LTCLAGTFVKLQNMVERGGILAPAARASRSLPVPPWAPTRRASSGWGLGNIDTNAGTRAGALRSRVQWRQDARSGRAMLIETACGQGHGGWGGRYARAHRLSSPTGSAPAEGAGQRAPSEPSRWRRTTWPPWR